MRANTSVGKGLCMIGAEHFELNGKPLGFTMLDFWQYQYSNIYNIQEYMMEFLVAKALGIDRAQNVETWTLYDMLYRGKRIEIKTSSYYHPWNEGGKITQQRVFGIQKANSNYENPQAENHFERQNDIYVFCLNTGKDRESAYPLNLNHWEFYIVPTAFINSHCQNQKTISLNRIRNFGFEPKRYDAIRRIIDRYIDEMAQEQCNDTIDA